MTEIELGRGLRAWADGSRGLEAAVGLLIAHRMWIVRATTPPPEAGIGPFPGAELFYQPINHRNHNVVDWAVARHLTRSTSTQGTEQDRQMLMIATTLAEEADANRAIVAKAVEHSAGFRHTST